MTNRDIIIELRKQSPCATLQTMGDKIGISKERVRQILKEAGLPTQRFRQQYLCCVCGGAILDRNRRTNHSPFCSHKCFHEYHNVVMVCDYCDKTFERRLSSVLAYPCRLNKRNPKLNSKGAGTFCSKKCHGQWFSKHYGFTVHPENSLNPLKYNYSEIDQLHIEGLSYAEISRRLNIPLNSIYGHNYCKKQKETVGG